MDLTFVSVHRIVASCHLNYLARTAEVVLESDRTVAQLIRFT